VVVTPSEDLSLIRSLSLTHVQINVPEYEAYIIGLALSPEMRIDKLEVFSDSQLIIRQINDQYEVKMLL